METNNIFANFPQEGDTDPFKELETTPTESQPENVEEEVKPEVGEVASDEAVNTPSESQDDDNIPFHKHPRWIEREQKLQELLEEREENQRIIADLSNSTREVSDKLSKFDVVSADIPDWFSELYGENETAWIKYQQQQEIQKEELKQEILREQAPLLHEMQERLENEKWNTWVNTEMESLESKGYKFDRNALMKTVLEFKPTDSQGNFDLEAGYKILQLKSQPQVDTAHSQARKQIASTATKTTNTVGTQKDYLTTNDLRHKSWNQL